MEEERIGLFIDYENLAIGTRQHLKGVTFEFGPIADALAERGRVVVRRAYADWSYFEEDRRMLTRNHIELIDIPQKMGGARKNAADIKLCVDALELSFERDYISTFVICTGDSDFTPLVHKLRERNKRVIGIGVEKSTSVLLPPACDEFLYYDRLEGVEIRAPRSRSRQSAASRNAERPPRAREAAAEPEAEPARAAKEPEDLPVLISKTLAGLKRSSGDAVLASILKRTLLRKDPTFNEADHGFRAFGELLRHLADQRVLELTEGSAKGDPMVDFPRDASGEKDAFGLLVDVVTGIEAKSGPPPLSGLKNEMRKRDAKFTEKRFGYSGFLQFCKAARAQNVITMDWDDDADDYLLRIPT